MMQVPIRVWLWLVLLGSAMLCISCKKCITCTARDTASGEVKFQQESCAKGPLLDDWQEGIKTAYPPPGYNTVCK